MLGVGSVLASKGEWKEPVCSRDRQNLIFGCQIQEQPTNGWKMREHKVTSQYLSAFDDLISETLPEIAPSNSRLLSVASLSPLAHEDTDKVFDQQDQFSVGDCRGAEIGKQLEMSVQSINLLNTLLQDDLRKFCSLLDGGTVDPKHFYKDPQNGTILDIACQKPEYIAFVKELLERGINSNNAILEASRKGNYQGLKELISYKETNVNAVNKDGSTALHEIAKNFTDDIPPHLTESFKICITELFNHPSFNVNRKNKNGFTAIHTAVISSNRSAVKCILKNCSSQKDLDLDSNHVRGSTAREAISTKFPELACDLPKQKPRGAILEMCLLWALETGDLANYRRLLLDVTEGGFNPNHWFRQPYNTRCLEMACKIIGADFVQATLNAGADPNCINLISQRTPLHVAIEVGNRAAVKVLLDNEQIEINAKDSEGKTPLHIAAAVASRDKYHKECLILLLDKHNVSVSIEDNSGHIPADETDNDEIKQLITSIMPKSRMDRSLGFYKRTASNVSHTDPLVKPFFDLLIKENFTSFFKEMDDLGSRNNVLNSECGSYTLLQYACEKGLHEVVMKLLLKVDPNGTSSKNDRTPLMIACSQGDTRMVEILLTSSDKTNLDINKIDSKENTALHYAARKEDLETVTLLLKHGADTGLRNIFGKLALPPEETKLLLDKSLTTEKNYLPSHEKYAINFDYKLLISSVPRKPLKYKNKPVVHENLQENDLIFEPICCTRLGGYYSEMRFLHFLSNSPEHHDLLKHPLITSFLHVKSSYASTLSKWNTAFVFAFVILLNLFICLEVSNSALSMLEFVMIVQYITLVLTVILTVRELLQFIVKVRFYMNNFENIMDISIIILSLLLLLHVPLNIFLPWAQVGAILLSWLQLLLVTGRSHNLRNNLEMLKTVCVNYLFTLRSYIFIIIAFSLSFYVIFANAKFPDDKINGNLFSNPVIAVFKTVIMMTGEFESGDIPFVSNIWLSSIVFILFVFFLPVVLLNLLTALAVSDEQHIRCNAKILSIISQIKRLYEIENIVFHFYHFSMKLKFRSLTRKLEKYWLFPEGTCRDSYLRLWPNRGSEFELSSSNKAYTSITLDQEIVEEVKEMMTLRMKDKRNKSEAREEMLKTIVHKLDLLEDSLRNSNR